MRVVACVCCGDGAVVVCVWIVLDVMLFARVILRVVFVSFRLCSVRCVVVCCECVGVCGWRGCSVICSVRLWYVQDCCCVCDGLMFAWCYVALRCGTCGCVVFVLMWCGCCDAGVCWCVFVLVCLVWFGAFRVISVCSVVCGVLMCVWV